MVTYMNMRAPNTLLNGQSSANVRRYVGIAALAGSLAFATPVIAQNAGSATGQDSEAAAPREAPAASKDDAPAARKDDAIADVVVTARYRAESSQDVPLSITALSASDLEKRGVQNILDVGLTTPNVSLRPAGANSGNAIVAYIRGVGQSDTSFAFEPGVGFYFDDVYFGTLLGSQFELGDVDQVEILRGPQGTLFGKNSVGGAIRITSVKPKGDNSGYIEAAVGSYSRRQVRGAMDFGISDTLALRVSGGLNDVAGYVTTVDFVCAHPDLSGNLPRQAAGTSGDCVTGHEGGKTDSVLRASLLWSPEHDIEVRIIADIADTVGEPQASSLIAFRGGPGTAIDNYNQNVLLNPNSTFYTGVPIDNRFIPPNPYVTYSTFIDPSTGRTVPRESTVRSHGVTAKVDWKESKEFNVKAIFGYRKYTGAWATDSSNAPIKTVHAINYVEHQQYSGELRFTGVAFNNFLEWAAGAYIYEGDDHNPGFTSLNPLNVGPFYGLAFEFTNDTVTKNKSAFIHGVFNVTDALSLELGARYSDESKSYQFGRDVLPLNPVNPIFPPGEPLAGFENYPTVVSKDNRMDYKAAVSYQWTPNVLTYASFSTGFKGGGVNPRPADITQVLPFAPETLKAAEVGFKSTMFDRHLRFNAASFINWYQNLQLSIFLPNGSSIVSNAGKVRIWGVEAEMEARPVDGLSFNASLGYLNNIYTELGAAGLIPEPPTRNSYPRGVPKWTLSAGVQYEVDLDTLGMLTPRLDYNYQSRTYYDAPNSALASQAGYGTLNGRITWTDVSKDWSVSLAVSNITDQFAYVGMEQQLISYGTLIGQPNLPRTFLLTVRRNF